MKIAAAVLLAIISTAAVAEEESRLWLTATVRSYHLDRQTRHNEANYGLGVECRFAGSLSVSAGQYTNSRWKTSSYATANYTPLQIGPVKLGASAGAVTGYTMHYTPLFAPTAVIEGKTWGANLLAIPPFDGGSWVFGLQVKRRF